MAVRLDLFSAASRDEFVGTDPDELMLLAAGNGPAGDTSGGARWLGFVAASDADESELVVLLNACADEGVMVGAVNHGLGIDEMTAAAFAAVTTSTALARSWLDVIGWAAETAGIQRRHLGWMTRYDAAGTHDAGAEEWRTSWSDAPTEGTGADDPWPTP